MIYHYIIAYAIAPCLGSLSIGLGLQGYPVTLGWPRVPTVRI